MAKRKTKWIGTSGIVLTLFFFYIPIIVLMIFSFNSLQSNNVFGGFSLRWYQKMLNDGELIKAVYYTIFTAVVATIVSTVLGTLTAIGLSKSRRALKQYLMNVNDLPVLNPEIVTAIGLMLLFISVGIDRGLATLVLSHIAFCTPYVIISVYPKVRALDPNLADAAMDLGATPRQAFMKVLIPQLSSGIMAGALIAFTMSFDDFVISYFVSGNGVKNVSMFVYNASKRIDPTVNALFTIMVVIIASIMIFVNLILPSINKNTAKRKVIDEKVQRRWLIAKVATGIAVVVFVIGSVWAVSFADNRQVLRVFNWGEYIDKSVLKDFEREYNVKVIYETFDTNESMYTKLLSGSQYDVIIPSDYMIERLIAEDLIQPLDWSKIENKKEIEPSTLGLDYDPNGEYAAPYLYGTVGILYNQDKVSEADALQGWSILTNPTYKNRIFMYNSVRDGFMVPLKYLGFSLNSESEEELNKAYDWLVNQKQTMNPVYLIDTVIDQMKAGEKDVAVVYSGDANEIISQNDSMRYIIPKQGTNYWVDGMVITKNSKEVDLAHAFINYMCDPEIALRNTIEVGYTTPITEAASIAATTEFEGIDSYVVPPATKLDETYRDQSPEIRKLYDDLWTKFLAH